MLERPEYAGDTVNFRSSRKSFKNKAKIDHPKEEWVIFKNTHPAIIDRETFDLVQKLRQNKRRPTREGKVSLFSGMIFCNDCGSKMYFCTGKDFKHEQNWFTCSSARKNKAKCSTHFIREVQIEQTVLESMRRVFKYVQFCETAFAQALLDKTTEESRKELTRKQRELEQTNRRLSELDMLFKIIYEDNVIGKLSNERFNMLSASYENEQEELRQKMEALENEISDSKERGNGLETFIKKVKAVTEIRELTPELVHEFISKITVHEPYRENGKRYQQIDIYYNGVGIITTPTPDEMEEMFQEHLAKRKNNKKKTA